MGKTIDFLIKYFGCCADADPSETAYSNRGSIYCRDCDVYTKYKYESNRPTRRFKCIY